MAVVPVGYWPGAVHVDQGGSPSTIVVAATGAVASDWGPAFTPPEDVPPPTKCSATKLDGTACGANHTRDSEYCIGHKRSMTALNHIDQALADLDGS